jgi:outer membrane protein assembly factor BamA
MGPRYHHISNHVRLNDDKLKSQPNISLPVPLPDGLDLTTAALGLRVKRDSTDSAFYPRSGSLLDITVDFFDPAFGAQRSYRNLNVAYNKYISFGGKNVLATHVAACIVTEDAPFFDVCLLGNSKDLRGYQMGQYRDDRMLDGQVEFRRELFWRIGAVAFVGTGEVARTFGDFNGSDLVPGGGIGLRYKLAQRNHLNLRADYAWGKNSRAFYMGIGEAF